MMTTEKNSPSKVRVIEDQIKGALAKLLRSNAGKSKKIFNFSAPTQNAGSNAFISS